MYLVRFYNIILSKTKETMLDLLTELRAVQDIFHIMKLYYVPPIVKSGCFAWKEQHKESVLREIRCTYV